MFNSGCLRLWSLIIADKITLSCRRLSNSKENIIKIINEENKYLYGKLLETQKQRKKTLSKASNAGQRSKKESIVEDNLVVTEELENGISTSKAIDASKQKSKKRKAKDNPIVTSPATSSSLIPETLITEESAVGSQDVESTQGTSKKRKTKYNAHRCSNEFRAASLKHLVNATTETDNDLPKSSSAQFTFKSTVPINETNFPLNNPLRMNSNNVSTENVLSYSFSDLVIKQYLKFPAVSKIIEETMSEKNKLILSRWRQKMINDLGEDGFNKYNEGMKAQGQEFHSAVRNVVLGKPADGCGEITCNALKSLSWMLEHVSSPMAVESIIAHPTLGYKGIPDCVAMFRNIPVVIDWKLSEKPKKALKDTYDAPVQITAYIGALNHDPNYNWEVTHGLVAVAYNSGDPCDVFLLGPHHCLIYWRHWLMRLDKFKERSHLHLDHNIDEKTLECS